MSEDIQSSATGELAEVFKAARALLKTGTEEQGVIIPTLAFARCVGLRWGECDAAKKRLLDTWNRPDWEQAKTDFNDFYTTCIPTEVVDGVSFIRRNSVSARAVLGTRENGLLSQALIDIYQSAKTTDGSVVAEAYRNALLKKDVSWEEGCVRAVTTHEFLDDSLHITAASTVLAGYSQLSLLALGEDQQEWIDSPELPSPEWIKVYYDALKHTSEFKERVSGKRGPTGETYNLTLAYVDYCLRSHSKTERQRHEILNKHVLCEHYKKFPENKPNQSLAEEKRYESAAKQLNNSVDTFEGRFEAALSSFILYFPPYLSYKD